MAVFIAVGHAALAVLISDSTTKAIASDLATVLISSVAAVCLFHAARRSKGSGRRIKTAWTLLALAALSFAVGDAIWFYIYNIIGDDPFNSIADVPYLMFYPLFIFGILLLPAEPLSRSERLKTLLDTAVVMIGAILFFWTLLIAPQIASPGDSDEQLTITLSVAYPVMDFVLLFALIELLFRRLKSSREGPLLLLAAGTAFMIMADTAFLSQILKRTYEPGGIVDVGWTVAFLLFALAGILQSLIKAGPEERTSSGPGYIRFTWPFYLPYIVVGATYVLLYWSHLGESPVPFSKMAWGVGGIIGLVVIRQIAALNENKRLYAATLKEISERKQAEEGIKRLNEELEGRVADRTMELMAANRDLQGEVFERKRAEEGLQERDLLLSGIAVASNLLLTSSDYEAGIHRALEIVGISTGADRVIIFEDPGPLLDDGIVSGSASAGRRFEWRREDVPEGVGLPYMSIWREGPFNRWRDILTAGEAVRGLVRDLPESERAVLVPMCLVSFASIPIVIEDHLWGFVRLDDCYSERIWEDWEVSTLFTFGGSVGGAIIRHETEEVLKASIKEKEVLLKEVHHRVKNNMQIISSLLNLQAGYIKDETALDAFMESRSRIRSMALVHETLYRSDSLASIDFSQYIRSLADSIQNSSAFGRGIQIELNADRVFLDLDKALPCGLIINELLTNSIKHAFPETKKGVIHVDFHANFHEDSHTDGSGDVVLSIRDNGVGIPADFNPLKSKSMGLKLVNALVKQLKGSMDIRSDGGTEFLIRFPCISAKASSPGS